MHRLNGTDVVWANTFLKLYDTNKHVFTVSYMHALNTTAVLWAITFLKLYDTNKCIFTASLIKQP